MIKNFRLLDSVAILQPVSSTRLTLVEPEYESVSSLPVGLVGTIVEIYDTGKECPYLVEFAKKGRSLSIFTLECEFCKLLPVVIYLDNAPHYRAMISILLALPSTE